MKWRNAFKKVSPVEYLKKAGAFSIGVLVGVCYGSVVSTVTAYFLLSAIK